MKEKKNLKINPEIIDNFLDKILFSNALDNYKKAEDLVFDESRKRYLANDSLAQLILINSINIARKTFKSDTLLPTYALYSKYIGPGAILEKHKDDNACTYTLDLCLRQTRPWPIWVDDKEYTLEENQALAYYGNDQEHWRNPMVWEGSVEMIFLHYAEPDHWWFQGKRVDRG